MKRLIFWVIVWSAVALFVGNWLIEIGNTASTFMFLGVLFAFAAWIFVYRALSPVSVFTGINPAFAAFFLAVSLGVGGNLYITEFFLPIRLLIGIMFSLLSVVALLFVLFSGMRYEIDERLKHAEPWHILMGEFAILFAFFLIRIA